MAQTYRSRVILRSTVVILSLGTLAVVSWMIYKWQYAAALESIAGFCPADVPVESCKYFDLSTVWLMTALYVLLAAVVLLLIMSAVGGLVTYIFGPKTCRSQHCPCRDHRRSQVANNSNVVVAALATAAAVFTIFNI